MKRHTRSVHEPLEVRRLLASATELLPPTGNEWLSLSATTVSYGGKVWFTGDSSNGAGTGRVGGLFRSDGTREGTQIATDLPSDLGYASFNPEAKPVVAAGKLFLTVDATADRLYATDGTAAGTVLLPVSPAGTPTTVYNDRLYFTGASGSAAGVFESDGTIAGTRRIAAGSNLFVRGFANGYVYLSQPATNGAFTLKRTDGTTLETIGTVNSGYFESVQHFRGNQKIFTAAGPGQGYTRRLWVTDDTPAGTRPLDTQVDVLGGLRVLNGIAYFFASAPGGRSGLYRTNGTLAGTYVVADGLVSGGSIPTHDANAPVADFAGRLYYNAKVGSANVISITADGQIEPLDYPVSGSFAIEKGRLWINGVPNYVTADAPTHVVLTDGPAGGAPVSTAEGRYVSQIPTGGGIRRLFTWDSTTSTTPGGYVSGVVYRDDDGDGVRGTFETFLTAYKRVYVDLNDNGEFEPNEPSVVRGDSATFSIENVPAGTWTIAVAAEPGVIAPAGPKVRITVESRGSTGTVYLLASYKTRLSGVVFNDTNANGVRDSGEGTISGVRVFASSDPNATTPPAGAPNAYTDSNGRYLLTDVTPASGYVRTVLPSASYARTTPPQDLSTLPAGYVGAIEGTAIGLAAPGSVQFDVAADTDADGAITASDGSLGTSPLPTYVDLDRSGTFTTGDVWLLAADEAKLTGVPAGPQVVRAVLPQGWSGSWAGDAVEVVVPAGGTVRVPQLVLTPSTLASAALRGRVASDDDFDKAVTAADPGVALLPVWWDANKDGARAFTESYTLTRADGQFAFAALDNGVQRIAFGAAWVALGGVRYTDVDAALTPVRDVPVYAANRQVRVIGTVRLDANGNNTLDASDPVLSGAPLTSQQQKSFSTPTVSGPDGRFAGYGAAGLWSPTLAIASGYSVISVSPAAATLAVGDTSPDYTVVVKGPSPTLAKISGTMFDDANFNGTRDAGEAGLANIPLFADLDGNGSRGTSEPLATTAGDGTYTLYGIRPGAADVIASLVLPNVLTNGANNRRPVTIAGVDLAGIDLAVGTVAPVTVNVIKDYDRDGTRGTFDTPVNVTRVWADLDGNGVFDAAADVLGRSTSTGVYSLAVPPNQAATVYADLPSGYAFTGPTSVAVPAGPRGVTRAVSLFLSDGKSVVTGRAYYDYNQNGVLDSNEKGTAGTVTLRDPATNAAIATSAITYNDDVWEFTNLTPGTYRLTFAPGNADYEGRENAAGVLVTVGTGQVLAGPSFGYFYTPRYYTGRVFRDLGTREAIDPADTPLAGVRAFVDADYDNVYDPGEPFALTDAAGEFRISNVQYVHTANGSGYLRNLIVENPSGFVRTYPYMNGIATEMTQTDAGTYMFAPPLPNYTASGRVYKDLNTNGTRDADEPGIPFVQVGAGFDYYNFDAALTDREGQFYYYGNGTALRTLVGGSWIATDPLFGGAKSRAGGIVDFGYVDFQIGGRLFVDSNGNGKLDNGETPTAGRRVWIDEDNDNTFDAGERQTTSDADGYFAFAATGAGTFHLVQEKPAGESGVSAIDVTVQTGGAVGGLTFGGASVPGTAARLGVGDGTGQRSRIGTATVTLGDVVSLAGLAEGAITLTRVGGPAGEFGVQVTAVTSATGGGTAVTLGFTGSGIVGGSLPDGRYVLSVDGRHITNASGLTLDVAGNGVRGSSSAFAFYRLFGDIDGDGGVSVNDFNAFTPAFGKRQGQAGYVAAFDSDGDNGISINDFNEFSNRFGKSINAQTGLLV